MEKTRIGIIGCGGIANGKHMPSLSKLKNAEMVYFCDIVRERAEKAAKQYGTTVRAVTEANRLEEAEAPAEQMLLIPM